MMNILNGGAHADSNVDIQEFMIAPIGAATFAEALAMGTETYHALKAVLKKDGLSTGLGDEGGFAPNLSSNRAALDLIVRAVEKAGYAVGTDIAFALDVAATEFHDDGAYAFEGKKLSADEMTAYYTELVDAFPIVSIEDPLSEEDWDGWIALTDALGDRVQIVGDDLFVTNPTRLADGIARGAANALLVKVNQIGTLTETLDAVEPRAPQRLPLHDEPPLRRDRGHHDRRPRRRHRLRPDQDRRPGPQRARRQVQPAAAHRGGARRRRPLRRRGAPSRGWRAEQTRRMSSVAAGGAARRPTAGAHRPGAARPLHPAGAHAARARRATQPPGPAASGRRAGRPRGGGAPPAAVHRPGGRCSARWSCCSR